MTVYMLYVKRADGTVKYELGGGSSTPSKARVYATEREAERMRARYFPNATIKPVVLD